MEKLNIHRLKLVLISTMICGLLAHAYVYFNALFNHDSAQLTYEQDVSVWQISIGRYLQCVYNLIRGYVACPFLLGMLSLLFLACSSYLIVTMLGIQKKISIICVCGILSVNPITIIFNSMYIQWIDICALSFFCAVLGVFICDRFKYGLIPASVLFMISMGLYQAYIVNAILLFTFIVVQQLIKQINFNIILKKILKYIFSIGVGTGLYLLGAKISLMITHVPKDNGYNSVFNPNNFLSLSSPKSIFKLIFKSYFDFFEYTLECKPKILSLCFLIAFLFIACKLIFIVISKKSNKLNVVLILILHILLPLIANMLYIIANGKMYEHVRFSHFVFLIWFVYMYEYCLNNKDKKRVNNFNIQHVAMYAFSLLFIFGNIVFSNQIYLKKDLEFRKTYSTLNRIIDRIEQTDGYVVNKTPVFFIGSLDRAALCYDTRKYFQNFNMEIITSFGVTYPLIYTTYIDKIMMYPITFLHDEDMINKLINDERIKNMTAFPDKDSCKMIDNVMCVKLSA